MSPDAISVTPHPDFTLEVTFATGDRRRFDMRPYLAYPAFAPLAETGLFMKAHVVNGVVTWTDTIDLSPDTLWIKGERVEGNVIG
ncbi:DUF2442 domain-containing protein [Roseospira goensis]|uniref:DUF2442 domain-containing protein n=1 Tax=Roseospira goensis TaxID=391922 RepID=A0A7W6RZ10_9PROT|nr:DUF2442 domain-containing protein [Roseospira goensis]MBB4285757.1 hypothetical protein [Roseospira goensis]